MRPSTLFMLHSMVDWAQIAFKDTSDHSLRQRWSSCPDGRDLSCL